MESSSNARGTGLDRAGQLGRSNVVPAQPGVRRRAERPGARVAIALAAGMAVAGLGSSSVKADATWVGDTSTDWNNAANWSSDPANPTGNFFVQTNTGNIATISANSAFVPVDLFVGSTAGTSARLDHTAGDLTTGFGNWSFVGVNGATGTHNLADTATTGGTFTGFGMGSGNFYVGNNVAGAGRLTIGRNAGGNGTFNMNTSGTLVARQGLSISIGDSGGTGTFNLDNGAVVADGEIYVGGSGTGTLNMSGGSISTGQWFVVGRDNGSSGTFNMTGGTVNAATNTGFAVIGSFGGATGTANISGGTFNSPRQLFVGEGGTGTLNVSGTGLVDVAHATEGLRLGVGASGVGVVNLNGGTIETTLVTQGTGSGTFNFNGGTLRAAGNATNFMGGITRANVRDGGAVLNSNGFNVTVAQPLLHSDVGGDAAIDGGLTKSGAGAVTLTGTNTYTGNTTVSGGRLNVGGTGDINTTGAIAVNGAGARFVNTSSVAVTPTVTVTSGGVDGTGTINTVNVASDPANTIANGNGGTGTLTIGTLDLAGAANFNLNVGGTAPVVSTTTLNTNGTDNVLVNASNALWAEGTYNLIGYSTLGGSGFAAFEKGTISGLSGRQSATLTNPAGFVALTIAGDNPRWSGALSNEWSTAVMANPKNWQLITSGAPTDYMQGDIVLFDDNATTTNPTISAADVTPSSVLFDNTTKGYTLSGPFGIAGTTGLSKSGTGALTIANANTYSGGTTLNSGTLNVNNANALGSGPLNVANGATIDNTSGSAVTLATNNAQVWNGDVTFGGANALGMGTGAVTRSGPTTVTVNGTAPVTLGGAIGGSGALTKAGPGTLAISGTSNTYTGPTNVSGGTLSVAGSVTTSPNAVVSGGTLAVPAGGTLTNGNTTVTGGSVVVGGTATVNGDFSVALGNNSSGSLQVQNGGTVNGDVILVGQGNSPTALANGSATIAAGATVNTTRWFIAGHSGVAGSTGAVVVDGGTLNVRTSGTAGNIEIGTWDGIASSIDVNAGSNVRLQNNSEVIFGALAHAGTGTVNQNGGNVTFYSDAGTTVGGTGNVILGGNTSSGNYTYNLNGGSLTTLRVRRDGGASSTFNFNGGTLRANGNSPEFMQGLNRANVRNGGAVVDTNGFDATITQPLVHSDVAGDAATDGGLTKNGAGALTLGGVATYTGATTINGGTLRLAGYVAPVAVGAYSFDELPDGGLAGGTVVANTGTGGAAMDGAVNHADNPFADPNSTTVGAGKFGKGLTFDGLGSSVDVANRIVDQAGNGSWTLSAWVKTSQAGSALMTKNAGGNTWQAGHSEFYLGTNPIAASGGLPTAVRNGGGFVQGDQNVVDDAWHMLTFVSDAGVKGVYVDGVLLPLNYAAFTNADTATLVRLGYHGNTVTGDGGVNFAGSMDELKFFNGALDASQIQALFATNTFAAGTGKQYLPTATPVNISAAGASLDLGGNSQTIGSLAGVAGSSVALGAGTLTTGGNNASTTFAGSVGGTGGVAKAGTGTFTLSAANTHSGGTAVNAGVLVAANADALGTGPLAVADGATARLQAGLPTAVSLPAPLGITAAGATGGTLDITNNGMAVRHADQAAAFAGHAAVNALVRNAFNEFQWNQPGVTSSTVAADVAAGIPAAVGILLNNDGGGNALFYGDGTALPQFEGRSVDGNSVLVKDTLLGDGDLNGTVDSVDFALFQAGYTGAAPYVGFAFGDYDYNGVIDSVDFGLFQAGYQYSQSNPTPEMIAFADEHHLSLVAAAVPEPAALGVLALGAVGLLGRRRRRA